MDVDYESDLSSGGDESDDNDVGSQLGPGQARFRKRKLARILGGGAGGGASSKRGRTAEGGSGGGGKRPGSGNRAGGGGVAAAAAAADIVPVERLDWPSTVIPRTPYDVPLLLSCLSTYPDKASVFLVVVCVWGGRRGTLHTAVCSWRSAYSRSRAPEF